MIEKHTHELETLQFRVQPSYKSKTPLTTLQFDVAALSDIVDRRANDEDSFGYDLETKLFVVCDGMGGSAGGEVASQKAVGCALRTYRELSYAPLDQEQRLHSAISSANQAIWSRSQQDQTLRGMGTTLVAASVFGNRVLIGNVGDSRAYFLR